MPSSIIRSLVVLLFLANCWLGGSVVAKADKPLEILLVAGGCCHDYVTQSKLLEEGLEERLDANVTVVLSEEKTTTTKFDIYQSDQWADEFDVVIHDECSARVTEKPYIERILAAHRSGTPAVNLHCAMHSYRSGNFRVAVEPGADNAGWYEMIGVQSSAHGAKAPIDVVAVDSQHTIMKGFEDWRTGDEELYNNIRVFSGASVLVKGDQVTPPGKKVLKKDPDAKSSSATAVIAWTNAYGPNKTRIFSTSLGHQNETVMDDRYLDFISRGVLWASGRIDQEVQ